MAELEDPGDRDYRSSPTEKNQEAGAAYLDNPQSTRESLNLSCRLCGSKLYPSGLLGSLESGEAYQPLPHSFPLNLYPYHFEVEYPSSGGLYYTIYIVWGIVLGYCQIGITSPLPILTRLCTIATAVAISSMLFRVFEFTLL
jgi:hypothetical protein